MSADAASLPCPICAHTGVFDSVQSLRDKLISVSTSKILCPVCQEEVIGLDKLTIHLFSHVNIIPKNVNEEQKTERDIKSTPKIKQENQSSNKTPKKLKPPASKNKAMNAPIQPVKFVKIYPKLPVISLSTVPILDISRSQPTEDIVERSTNTIYIPTTGNAESVSLTQTNTICNVCGLQFADEKILKMHKCIIHNIDANSNLDCTRYQCHICPKNFKMRGSLMVHLRVAHYGFKTSECKVDENTNCVERKTDETPDDPLTNLERNDNKQWQCDVCRKCFTTKYFLKKHKRLHTGETPYACTQCNKTFTFQQSYHKHLLYHNDEKPHVCSYCGRAFKELSTLHNHQRIHTGEKPFSCETCGKCFRQRVSYLVHRRIHTGVMPYKCTACDKNFRYKVSQRTHKCQAQPPGTVVRQSGDLVEKLKKKHDTETLSTTKDKIESNLESNCKTSNDNQIAYHEISEANAELVRRGAKLSFDDVVSDNFSLIAEAFENQNDNLPNYSQVTVSNEPTVLNEVLLPNLEDLIEAVPCAEQSVPSPSEIFKNLCLSKDDDYIGLMQNIDEKNYNTY